MAETVWAVFPPMLTIVLALATKEVYMSLLIGIFSGAMLYTDFNVLQTILTMFAVMEEKVGKNVNILVFLVILGIIVAAITRSGATAAYGSWAAKHIKGKRSSLLLTALLGLVIFIDDYFIIFIICFIFIHNVLIFRNEFIFLNIYLFITSHINIMHSIFIIKQ